MKISLRSIIFAVFFTALLSGGCRQSEILPENVQPEKASDETQKIERLQQAKEAVAPFFQKMGKPQTGDWLESNAELGETFEQYLKNKPTLPTAVRRTIYIQPIGNFSDTQRKVLLLTAAYMRAFFDLPVQLKPEKRLENVPRGLTRKNPYSGQTQINTAYFLRDLLPKMISDDAAALVCLTDSDLFPEEGWSFVFGQADLRSRVGVWSLYRLGSPEKSEAAYRVFLARVLKIAMHETGHMFSMRHCTKYECLMSGTNNLTETDRRPLDVCPECMAKICWAMDYAPAARYEKLAKFWAQQGWREEENLFTKKREAVKNIFVKGN